MSEQLKLGEKVEVEEELEVMLAKKTIGSMECRLRGRVIGLLARDESEMRGGYEVRVEFGKYDDQPSGISITPNDFTVSYDSWKVFRVEGGQE